MVISVIYGNEEKIIMEKSRNSDVRLEGGLMLMHEHNSKIILCRINPALNVNINSVWF